MSLAMMAQEVPTTRRRGRPPKKGRPLLRVLIPACKSVTKTRTIVTARSQPARPKRAALGTINKPVIIHESDSEEDDSDDEDYDPGSDMDMESERGYSASPSSSGLDSSIPPEVDWEPFFPPKVLVSLDSLAISCEGEEEEEDEETDGGRGVDEGEAVIGDDNLVDWRDGPGISDVSAFVILSRWEDDSIHSGAHKTHDPLGKTPTPESVFASRSFADAEDSTDILDVEMLLGPGESYQEPSYRSNTRTPSDFAYDPSERGSLGSALPCGIPGSSMGSLWLSSGPSTPRRCLSPDSLDNSWGFPGTSEPPSSPSLSESGYSTSSAFTLSSPLPPFRFQKGKAAVRATAMRRTVSAPATCGAVEPTPLLHQLVRFALECPIPDCSESFGENSLREFERHFQLKHSPSGARHMPCPCTDVHGRPHKVYLRTGDMGKHVWKRHLSVVGFVCRGCEKRTSTGPDIVEHISRCSALTTKPRASTTA